MLSSLHVVCIDGRAGLLLTLQVPTDMFTETIKTASSQVCRGVKVDRSKIYDLLHLQQKPKHN